MQFNELTEEQRDKVIEREIEDFRNNPDQNEALEFFISYWLEHSKQDIVFEDDGDWQYN